MMFDMTNGDAFMWCLKLAGYGLLAYVGYLIIGLLDLGIEYLLLKITRFCNFKHVEKTERKRDKLLVAMKYTWLLGAFWLFAAPLSLLAYDSLKWIPLQPALIALVAITAVLIATIPYILKWKSNTWYPYPMIPSSLGIAGAYSAIVDSELSLLITFPLLVASLTASLFSLRLFLINKHTYGRNSIKAKDHADDESNTNIVNHARKARYSFKDVAGMSELKVAMLKAGNQIVSDKPSNGKHKNGVLFHGAPGNGKTFFAEAFAGELKLPFLSVSFGNIASQWVGETTRRAMQVFDDAEAQAPCMLFIDEIDSVFIDRGSVKNGDSEGPKTLNAILTRLVDIRGKGVIVVGATNYLEKLDGASIREGRFDFKIEIPNPDMDARVSLLKTNLRGFSVADDDLLSVAKRWEGFSVSRMVAIADKAKDIASENPMKHVNFEVLTKALRDIQGSKGDKIAEDIPTVDKLFLNDEMRNRLNNIIERMKNIDSIEKFGGNAPSGILFTGPPGTGKTLGAQVVAKTCGWAFLQTTGNSLIQDPEEMDKLMRRASDIRPCIIFIDESDDILADRNGSYTKSATNRLLSVMDGAGGKPKDVVFIAATNYPDLIDAAMLRGGRFTEKIEFKLPDFSVIREYVANWIRDSKAPLHEEFTVDSAAHVLRGQSLANVKAVLQGAVNESVGRLNSDANASVGISDLQSALRLIVTN